MAKYATKEEREQRDTFIRMNIHVFTSQEMAAVLELTVLAIRTRALQLGLIPLEDTIDMQQQQFAKRLIKMGLETEDVAEIAQISKALARRLIRATNTKNYIEPIAVGNYFQSEAEIEESMELKYSVDDLHGDELEILNEIINAQPMVA